MRLSQCMVGQATMLLVFIAMATASCKRNDSDSAPLAKPPVAAPTQSVENVPQPASVCPTQDDVSKSKSKLEKLIAEAQRISKAEGTSSSLNEANISAQVETWRRDYEDWKDTNTKLSRDCYLLLGADGTQVYPEIPASLKCLNLAGIWIDTAVDLLEAGENGAASTYVKEASAASARAGKILDSDLPTKSKIRVVQIPKALRKAVP